MTGNRHYTKLYPCACCGFLTRDEDHLGDYGICPVCGWEDDASQEDYPTLSGANRASLCEARECFKKHRCADLAYREMCRPPLPDELPPGVRPLGEWNFADAKNAEVPQPSRDELSNDELRNVLPISEKEKKK